MGCCFGPVDDPVSERAETDAEPGFFAAAMAFAGYGLHAMVWWRNVSD